MSRKIDLKTTSIKTLLPTCFMVKIQYNNTFKGKDHEEREVLATLIHVYFGGVFINQLSELH